MSLYSVDSIVALATARGIGALSIVRVSGDLSSNIFKSLTGIKNITPRFAYYSILKSKNKSVLDDAIAIFYKGPNSFTGEDSFEITCHGGEIVASRIINEILGLGCRHAEFGEFSKRAVLNGKISIEKAEVSNSVIKSTSVLSAKKGLMGLQGEAKRLLKISRKKITRLLAIIEHELDFVDGEIDETSSVSFINSLNEAIAPLKEVSDGTLVGNKLKSGFRAALIGRPNAGKSTLFNAMLGYDRSIISPVKGTTRDSLEVFVDVGGVPVELIDTAGFWEVGNELDALGVQKTLSIIESSDVLIIVDEKNPIIFSKELSLFDKSCLFVRSKCDKDEKLIIQDDVINLSSHNRKNIDVLLTSLSTLIKTSFLDENVFVCSSRQASLIKKTLLSLFKLKANYKELDLVQRVSSLRHASENLFDVYGEISNNDVLNNIFQDFCVGK